MTVLFDHHHQVLLCISVLLAVIATDDDMLLPMFAVLLARIDIESIGIIGEHRHLEPLASATQSVIGHHSFFKQT